jgi:hypothetical protein
LQRAVAKRAARGPAEYCPIAIGAHEGRRTMTAADITLIAFTLCNSFRLLAYLPQIAKMARDRSGAEATSFTTWGLFLFANISAVAYALVNAGDWTMAAMFLGNAAGCTAILLIGAWKRSQYRSAIAEHPPRHGEVAGIVDQHCAERRW